MSNPKQQLERDLQEAGRRLSTSTVAFHRHLGERLGLNGTDHKCVDILLREGAMTAGELAQRSGYTTGAITGVVNRLIAKGLASRELDPSDRRRVVLQANASETRRLMQPLLQPMIQKMSRVHARYTADQLRLILDYLNGCEQALRESTVPEPDALDDAP